MRVKGNSKNKKKKMVVKIRKQHKWRKKRDERE